MSRDLLRFIVSLLLTQANEVFLEKTLAGKSSPGLCAKLANGVAKGYADLADKAKEWNSQEIVDRTWTMLLNTKAKHYLSVTQYSKALADIAASNHGHALVRFTMAESLSKEAVKFANQFSSNYTSSGPSASASTTLGYTNPTNSAFTFPSDAGQSIVGLTSSHLAIVSQRRVEAVKDNDLIYHDILPSESTLPVIDETSPAQMISIQEVYSSPEVQRVVGPDLFAKLVPLGVHERASMYSEEKAKLVRAETERSESSEGERVATLDAMGLPASLERFKAAIRSGGQGGAGIETLADPGPEVMAWSDEEIKGGPARGADGISAGSAGVNETLSRIATLRKTAQSDLQNASELLDEESRLCEKARVRIGHKFGQEPSGGQTRVKDLRSEIKANREHLRNAEENDGRIVARWNEIQSDVELLARGRSALEQAFAETLASSDASASNGASLLDLSESEEQASSESLQHLKAQVDAIESALTKLSKIKKEKDSLLAELREKLQSDDIGHLLILSHRGGSKHSSSGGADTGSGAGDENPAQAAQEAALFRQELEKFRPWQNRLGQAHAAQAHLLAEISSLWNEINSSSEGKRISSLWENKSRARSQLVERLRRARDANAEVRAGLAKGIGFYEEAGDIARGLKAGARNWNEERAREREGMERQADWDSKLDTSGSGDMSSGGATGLERSMGSMGLSNSGLPQPPQRQSSYTFSPSPSPSATGPPPPRSYASPPPLPGPGSASGSSLPQPPPQFHTYSSFSSNSALPNASSTPQQSSYYSQPPPPAQQTQRSPYGFSSITSGPLADAPRGAGGAGGAAGGPPPPPPAQYASYQPAPTSAPQQGYGTGSGGLPPPPPSRPTQSYGQPSYGQPQPTRTPSYGSPAPPTPNSYGGGNSYASLPPPPPPQQQHYGAPQPQPPQGYGYGYAGGGGVPPAAPPSSSTYQHHQHHSGPPPPPLPGQPPQGGYSQPQQQQYLHHHQPPPPPPPQGQWRGY